MRPTRPLARALAVALATLLLAAAAGTAGAALPGRTAFADLVRLGAYGRGHVDAAGPHLAVAAGLDGASSLGDAGCGEDGMTFRTIVRPRAGLRLDVPAGARRLDLLARSFGGDRDVTAELDGQPLGVRTLAGGTWQRLSFALPEGVRGVRSLNLTVPDAGDRPPSAAPTPTVAPRAHLHALAFNTREQPPAATVLGPLAQADGTLWLEAGEVLEVPLPLRTGKALETGGVRTRGDAAGLRVRVELVSPEGAAVRVTELPAVLDLPWNADLGDPRAANPAWLRLSVLGEGDGAVGLVAPVLTGPARDVERAGAPAADGPVVVVAVRGLRAEDAEAVGRALEGAAAFRSAWTTSTDDRSALASLVTGRYVGGHGVAKRGDALAEGIPTVAAAAAAAGWRTAVRGGLVPVPADDPLWRGFADVQLADRPGVLPHAEQVLDRTLAAVRAARDGRIYALAVLGDAASPLIPRGEAWKRYWPEGDAPPWGPAQSRAAFARLAAGQQPPDARTTRFLQALRRGKVDELTAALAVFAQALDGATEGRARLLVVGLGGEDAAAFAAPTPANARVPLWVRGLGPLPAADSDAAVDLTDVAATVVALVGGARVSGLEGVPLGRLRSQAFPSPAFVTAGADTDLVVLDRLALRQPRAGGGASATFARGADGWRESGLPTGDDTVWQELLERGLEGWLGAGGGWREVDAAPGILEADPHGYATSCAR